MSEDGSDSAPFVAKISCTPRSRVKIRQQDLVHAIVQSISLQYLLWKLEG